MHDLKSLRIPYSNVEPKALEYLLPTEDNALGGCPELVDLDLCHVEQVDIQLLKSIILALPKLKSLKHELFVNALRDLTEEEMGVDTARYVNTLYGRHFYGLPNHSFSLLRYTDLDKSPGFQRIRNNITNIDIPLPAAEVGQIEPSIFANVLISMPKLRSISLCNIGDARRHVLPVLESIGHRLEYLDLHLDASGNLSIQDIMMTCRNLVKLNMYQPHMEYDDVLIGSSLHHDQVECTSKLPVLEEINLNDLGKDVCSADGLIALLQSPNLNKISLRNLEAMSDDVMFKALSSPDYAALSNVIQFSVKECSLLTEGPLVNWITRENCSLQYIGFWKCENMDIYVLQPYALEYHRALIIMEEEFTHNYFTLYDL